MSEELVFKPFPKIPRLSRECVITEKIDGTNAQIYIGEDGSIRAGSRNRWITPGNDNYGFATWVESHADELKQLGPGPHYGEWWGAGIQRRYGLQNKRFSLFNVHRWTAVATPPSCCDVVPVLYHGEFVEAEITKAINILAVSGSRAAPGFMDPEGIVIYHVASGHLFKKTIKDDAKPKASLTSSAVAVA